MDTRIKPKKFTDLIVIERLKKEQIAGYSSNCVRRVKKRPKDNQNPNAKKFENIWYLKYDQSNFQALCEVVAQEFFRLLIPGHPKTRLVNGNASNPRYVLSKEVPGYRSLQSHQPADLVLKLSRGQYFGLGEVLAVAMFVDESDLKLANMCLNKDGRIIKLDGDRCYANLLRVKEHHSKVTADDLANPFKPKVYSPSNWLEYLAHFEARIKPSPTFMHEYNMALMKICLLPESLIKAFVLHYSLKEEDGLLLALESINRKNMLLFAALKQPSFRDYVLSEQAQVDANDFIDSLNGFHPRGKKRIVDDLVDNLIKENISGLKKKASDISWNQTWMGTCQRYAGTLWSYVPSLPHYSHSDAPKENAREMRASTSLK